ncbi:MAG TPA: hypothetical protein VHY32_10400 [Caulobacteraceae bacterium]|jgi:Skp family chaperone for outer membrane proteins|nr:hypothetical protein [Caulobacteraceae bacterium]
MQKKTSLLGSAAFGVLVAVGLSATAPAADAAVKKHHKAHHAVSAAPKSGAAEELHALSEQVQALTAKLQEQEQATQAAQAQAQQAQSTAAEAQASAHAAQEQTRAEIDTIPGAVKTEIAAEKPKDGKAHYKGVTLTVGGFAAAEGVYRSRNEIADIGSSFTKIPFDNNAVGHTSELRGTARQSRLSLLAEGDIDQNTHAAFYTELDFLAAAQTGNSNESNSYSPRIRNVYGTLDWNDMGWGGGLHLLAGQNWSLLTMNAKGITPRNELTPATIDAQYVVGFAWARQPQARITADFDNKQIWAAVSVENPQTTFASAATGTTGTSIPNLTVTNNGAPTSQFDSTNTLSLNHVPDVIGKLAFEPELFGARPLHLEVFGIYRQFYDRVNVTAANVLNLPLGASNRETDGGGVGGGFTYTVVPKLLDLQGSIMTGKGLGRYGSGQLPDTVVGPNGELKAIPETMFLGGVTVHATPALDLYVYGGEEHQNRVATTIGAGHYGYGSPFANLSNCSVEGASCSPDIQLMTQLAGGFWDKIYQGSYGQVRVGVQYSYTELTAFSGAIGGQPKTNDSMVFTSFRYYPF